MLNTVSTESELPKRIAKAPGDDGSTQTPCNDNPLSSKPRLAEQIRKKCFDCSPHEPTEPGTHLEQVACCTAYECALHPVRPTPRHTRVNGFVDEAKVQQIIEKIDRINAKRRPAND